MEMEIRFEPYPGCVSRRGEMSRYEGYLTLARRCLAFSAASLPGYLAMMPCKVFLAAGFLFISCWLLAMLSMASGALALSGKAPISFSCALMAFLKSRRA